jgi:putative FmdB family regulatory protein
MPLYELKCLNKDCEYEFVEQHKLAEVEEAECPECGSQAKIEMRTNPLHYRHVSWSTWRMGHGS